MLRVNAEKTANAGDGIVGVRLRVNMNVVSTIAFCIFVVSPVLIEYVIATEIDPYIGHVNITNKSSSSRALRTHLDRKPIGGTTHTS